MSRALPSNLTPELTVAAVIEQNGRFLVVEERVHGHEVINQPAGHVEAGESLLNAVIRETLEETAWHFDPAAITGIYLWRHPERAQSFLRVTFCGACRDHDGRRPLDAGIQRTLWLSRQELAARSAQLRSPMVLRSIDDYLNGTRLPCGTIQELSLETLAQRAAVI